MDCERVATSLNESIHTAYAHIIDIAKLSVPHGFRMLCILRVGEESACIPSTFEK